MSGIVGLLLGGLGRSVVVLDDDSDQDTKEQVCHAPSSNL